jgi:hypothetical protein
MEIRKETIYRVDKAGYLTNNKLPIIDWNEKIVKTQTEIIYRSLCLSCIVYYCFKTTEKIRTSVLNWSKLNGVYDHFTPKEIEILSGKEFDLNETIRHVESMYTFAWCLGFYESNTISMLPDSLADKFPLILEGEGIDDFVNKSNLIGYEKMYKELDFLYMLHWGITSSELSNLKIAKPIIEYVVRYRRKSLEWILGDFDWDEVSMDT